MSAAGLRKSVPVLMKVSSLTILCWDTLSLKKMNHWDCSGEESTVLTASSSFPMSDERDRSGLGEQEDLYLLTDFSCQALEVEFYT